MKTSCKFAWLAAFGLALAGWSAQAQPTAQPNSGGGPPHARFGQVLQGVIQAYDANQDGQLDSTEMATLQQAIADGKIEPPGPAEGRGRGFGGPQAHISKELLDTYDADKDGKLNDTERAALRQDIHDGKLPPPEFRRAPGGPMRAPLTAQQILERFDADQDGRLDSAELTAFLDSRPGAGPLHRGGGGRPFRERPAAETPQN